MFDGKAAVVTGSARGIGRAVAETLAAGGARVVVADLDEETATATASEIDGETAVWAGDLAGAGAAESLIETAITAFGQLDIVVNNAGYTVDAPLHKMSDDDFSAMLEIHTVVPFRVLRAAAPYLREPARRERERGAEVFRKVVNVASIAAYGNPGQSNYATAKSGVLGLTKSLAKEWGALKINVNAVAFGMIETRLTQTKSDTTAVSIGDRTVSVGIPEQARDAMAAMVPLGRVGTVQEAAGGVAFLCSPWSDYVTGQVLNVSGGIPFAMGAS